MSAPKKEVVTVRIETKKREAVDELARALSRDRSFIINEAIDTYLATHRWQVEHIEAALRQAERGEFATEDEVERAFQRWLE